MLHNVCTAMKLMHFSEHILSLGNILLYMYVCIYVIYFFSPRKHSFLFELLQFTVNQQVFVILTVFETESDYELTVYSSWVLNTHSSSLSLLSDVLTGISPHPVVISFWGQGKIFSSGDLTGCCISSRIVWKWIQVIHTKG